MEPHDLDNKLTAWWLDMAPARQEDLLRVPAPPMPWLAASLADAGITADEAHRFLEIKRQHPGIVHDAGVNPRPN